MTTRARPLTVLGLVLGALVLLLWAGPSPTAALQALQSADSSPDPTAPLIAVLALLAQAVAGWGAVAVLTTLAGQLPGGLGRAFLLLSGTITPPALRRCVQLALGLTLTVGAVGAGPASAAPRTGWTEAGSGAWAAATGDEAASPGGQVATGRAPDLDWPLASAGRRPAVGTPGADVAATSPTGRSTVAPSSAPPAGSGSPSPAGPAGRGARPAPSAAAPSASPSSAPGSTPPAGTAPTDVQRSTPDTREVSDEPRTPVPRPQVVADTVVVAPGDSLWTLTATHLTRTGRTATARVVAAQWPRWWAANRDVIGEDPDLILPGTVLAVPPDVAPN